MTLSTSNSAIVLSSKLLAAWLLLLVSLSGSRALSSSSTSASANRRLRAVFSDVDGTLVHYAKDFEKHGVRLVSSDEETLTAVVEGPTGDRRDCRLLPSLTMGPACVSERTIELVNGLRKTGVLFGVVTAARKSTMLTRWPLLPDCDVRVSESGSRIWVGEELDAYFAARFESICGPMDRELVGADSREEPLWQFFRQLREEVPDLKVDAKSYYGMFRTDTQGDTAVEAALRGRIESALPTGVSWAMNLGKYDFYPSAAGKGNAVKYLQERFGISKSETACLFDDDNDLCMAEQCGTHWLPGLTSRSVVFEAAIHPSWHVAKKAGQGVFAIEECLEALLYRAEAEQQQQQQDKEEMREKVLVQA